MKFTFVVPVYNAEDTIAKALEALLNQVDMIHKRDYDILVVNDGSTDKTLEIIETYPVKVISNSKNLGRVETRKKGALAATTKLLAFIDARVIASKNLAFNISKLDYTPAIAADMSVRENKYKSIFDTVFFLIRGAYYGKKYFAKNLTDTFISKKNFTRSPKGTTLLVIEKPVFLKILPAKIKKATNDDTTLFHNLIYLENTKILRSSKLKIEYLQRSNIKSVVPWLFHRGEVFADFYINRTSVYRLHFLLSIVILICLLILIWFVPKTVLLFIGIYLGINAYLSENIRDWFTLLFTFPLLALIFTAGLIKYLITTIYSRLFKF